MNRESQRYYADHPNEWPTYNLVVRIAFEHRSFDEEAVMAYGLLWEDLCLMQKMPEDTRSGLMRRMLQQLAALGWNAPEDMTAHQIARIVLIQAYPNE